MELLERDPVLGMLLEWWGEAAGSEGRLILLGGEAGVGKTSVVRSIRSRLQSRARVLIGGCDPLSTPRPLEPLFDIASQLQGELDDLLRRENARDDVFRSFLAALRQARPPWLVVLEDVHWADEATMDLLRFLGRRVAGCRAMLIVTYRHDEVGPRHPLQAVLGDLATSAATRRVVLQPLSEAAVRTLAAGRRVDPSRLYAQTNGNPFFVTEVLASDSRGIPGTVRDAVLARAARLSPRARDVLDGAAIIGARAEPQLLAALTGASTAAVEECLGSGVLQEAGTAFAFRHELAREAVLEGISLPRRLALHGEVVRILEASASGEDHHARLAHHAEEAQDAAAVLRHAPPAGAHAASLGAHREAAAQYARALRLGHDLAPDERATLSLAFARASGAIDQQEEAIAALQEACTIWRASGDRRQEVAALCELAFWSVRSGRNTQAEEASRTALERAEASPPSPQLARAYTTQAYLRMLHRDHHESVLWAEKVLALPGSLVDRELEIETYHVMGTAQMMAGNDGPGVENLLHGIALSQETGHHRLTANGYSLLGTGSGELFHLERAERYLRASVEVAGEHDLDYIRLYSLSWWALVHLFRGRWAEAARTAQAVLMRPNAAAVSRVMASVALGRLRVRRGDPEQGPPLDEALRRAVTTGTLQRLAPAHCARAEAAWLAGDAATAVTEASAVYDLARHHRHPWFVGEMAYWRWKAGLGEETPPEAAAPFALQIAGRWREAAEAWNGLGCPYEEARALSEGDDEISLKRALRVFDELGALPASAATARRLREMGASGIPRGPRATTLANPAGLTARELQVLQVLSQGLQNREIAQRLHLSEKTVGHHVSAILSKLGVRNRREAVLEGIALGAIEGPTKPPG